MRPLIYLVWVEPENPETDVGYWNMFDSLEDAVEKGEVREIFTARPRSIGKYKMVTKPVRIKSRKKKK